MMARSVEKVALITGGGTGIGKAAALALARSGHAVVLAGRRLEPLDVAANEIEALGAKALPVPTDIGVAEAVEELFAKTKDAFGRLDLLFNNAGVGAPPVALEEITFAQWQAVISAILTGAFLCTQGAFKIMKAQAPQGGRIINNGSVSAYTPRPNSAPYTAAKHAISGLTKSTALDGRPFNIACGQVDIGNAATELTAGMASGVPQADGRVAVEPLMDVDDVGRAVAYMADLPLQSNVLSMTVMATQMPFVGRG
ncbi:MAG: SDR family NAD(P)-dependent oxidoreductase [Albidovulum sp.]|nr:SDR family NAD(P)-dependent oxidoreductase [Albidovulum sp.]